MVFASNAVLKFCGTVDKITGGKVSIGPPSIVPRFAQLVKRTNDKITKKLQYFKNLIRLNLPCKVTVFILTIITYRFEIFYFTHDIVKILISLSEFLIMQFPAASRVEPVVITSSINKIR